MITFATDAEVMAHEAPAAGAAGTLKIQGKGFTCHEESFGEDPDLVFSTPDTLVSEYALVNGRLYIWPQESCWAKAYTGGSGRLFGRWTTNSLDNVEIPAAFRSEECGSEYTACERGSFRCTSQNVDGVFEKQRVVLQVSGTGVQRATTARPCFARLYAEGLLDDSVADLVTIVESDCLSARIRNNKTGHEAVFTTELGTEGGEQRVSLTATYGDQTCRVTYSPAGMQNRLHCGDLGQDRAYSRFQECVSAAGLFER